MTPSEYPVDLRADRPPQSSRLWAVLTILLIKFLALIPHIFLLVFLGIAQWVVAFVAQIIVAARGEYPPGMFRFVVGVLRWSTRVSAFALSLSDRYPPFSLEPDPAYGVDVVIDRPDRQSRVYALFTVIVQILFIVGVIVLAVFVAREVADQVASGETSWSADTQSNYSYYFQSWGGGLLLRQIAAIPHLILLFFLGIALFAIWFVVQWVILFVASYPPGMYDFSRGVLRWQIRVQAYTLGLIDCYPPFSFDPSVASAGPGVAPAPPAPLPPGMPGAAPPAPGAPAPQTWQPAPPPLAPQAPPPPASAQPVSAASPETPSAPAPPPASAPESQAPQPAPPQWYPDPSGRHQHRYWDGSAWTPHVSDDGVQSTDWP